MVFLNIKIKQAMVLIAIAFLLVSCASYQTQVDQARKLMTSGDYENALSQLKPLADEEGKDQLVHALDYALALQIDGQYQKSIKYFLLAEKLADQNDYHSVSKLAASVLVNQEMVQYKGDEYEKLLINTMLAVNFAVLGNLESARVETKKSLEKLERMLSNGKTYHSKNPFVLYLNAIIWEANRDWDDAYIDYLSVYKLVPSFKPVQKDLTRLAKLSGRDYEYKKWKNTFSLDSVSSKSNTAEVILVFQQGWGPRKRPSYSDRIIPMLSPVSSRFYSGVLTVEGYGSVNTKTVFNVEEAAIRTLNQQLAPLIAKRVASLVAKKAVSRQVYKKDKGLGVLSDVVLTLSERADLRQWSLLPKTFQVARLSVKPGVHNIEVLGNDGGSLKRVCDFENIKIKKNEKKIISCRAF